MDRNSDYRGRSRARAPNSSAPYEKQQATSRQLSSVLPQPVILLRCTQHGKGRGEVHSGHAILTDAPQMTRLSELKSSAGKEVKKTREVSTFTCFSSDSQIAIREKGNSPSTTLAEVTSMGSTTLSTLSRSFDDVIAPELEFFDGPWGSVSEEDVAFSARFPRPVLAAENKRVQCGGGMKRSSNF